MKQHVTVVSATFVLADGKVPGNILVLTLVHADDRKPIHNNEGLYM